MKFFILHHKMYEKCYKMTRNYHGIMQGFAANSEYTDKHHIWKQTHHWKVKKNKNQIQLLRYIVASFFSYPWYKFSAVPLRSQSCYSYITGILLLLQAIVWVWATQTALVSELVSHFLSLLLSQSHSWMVYRHWHRSPFITYIPHGRG